MLSTPPRGCRCGREARARSAVRVGQRLTEARPREAGECRGPRRPPEAGPELGRSRRAWRSALPAGTPGLANGPGTTCRPPPALRRPPALRTTARSHANASAMTRPNGSGSVLACTTTSSARYTGAVSGWKSTNPARSPRPRSAARPVDPAGDLARAGPVSARSRSREPGASVGVPRARAGTPRGPSTGHRWRPARPARCRRAGARDRRAHRDPPRRHRARIDRCRPRCRR